MEMRKKLGWVLGPLLFLAVSLSPFFPGKPEAHRLFAVFVLTVVWWVTECLPLPVTALLIPVFLTTFRVTTAREAFAPFANPIIMLFLGSFVLARAMCVHGLDRKLAYSILSLKGSTEKKPRILLALGLTSVLLSLWISNTATTAMMYPIALGVMGSYRDGEEENKRMPFRAVLLLTLAYSASIGGIGTPIGSPPNLIAIGMLERLVGYRVTFFQWMMIGFLVLLPMFLVLFLMMKRKSGNRGAESRGNPRFSPEILSRRAGFNRAQVNVLIAFSVTATLWVLPGFFSLIGGREAPAAVWLRGHFPESVAAVIGAALLFFLPVDFRRGEFTLSLSEALRIDWGTLLLFGGGLSLGFQMFDTGLAESIGTFFISFGAGSAGPVLITLLAVAFSVFLTELTSNTASANMIIPIIIAVAQAASVDPLLPVLGSAIGCSFAFMLPVATPPNAIVYGSGMIRLPQMMRAGFWLNITGVLIIWLTLCFLVPRIGLI